MERDRAYVEFDQTPGRRTLPSVNARQIIDEITALPPDEQAKVIEFAHRMNSGRQLSGPELSALAERLAASTDPIRAKILREEIERGFYGGAQNA